MQAVRNILVVLDPDHAHSKALARAKLIAGVTKAHLHLLMCDKKQDHKALLSLLQSQLHDDGFNDVSVEQSWHDSLHESIISAQQDKDCQLVIKEHRPDSPLKKLLLTPTDWQLLRHCPCAVLMVKHEEPWADRVILAAVDVGNPDEAHRHLHSTIIDHGYEIAKLAKAKLHVISAHPALMLSTADPALQLSETLQARFREQCKSFQAEFYVEDQQLHIDEGPADVLILYWAQELKAAVTIVGTVARTGISGALIGNTAEELLDKLESDVLVLKAEAAIDKVTEVARE